MKKITILGSTGSIGTSALGVVRNYPDLFEVVGLAAGRNVDELSKQIEEFHPALVGVFDHTCARTLKERFPSVSIVAGDEGILEVASCRDTDFILSSIVGAAGLLPTIEAVRTGKTVGLANKESLVMAGEYVKQVAEKSGSVIIPVDSEHSAIFQCLQGHDRDGLKRLILTASGGPFARKSDAEMKDITVHDALNHPNWSMGRKVTIDSSTLMNKGLEVIEAYHLFSVDESRIKVLIHPQSIVHSMVEFIDGGIIAQLSMPDMSGPIAYALSYPKRLADIVDPCSLSEIGTLTFMEPDTARFPCLRLAFEALAERGTFPAVLNAANEVAVNAFLEERVSYGSIPVIIERTLSLHEKSDNPGLEEILAADRWARKESEKIIEEING